ncbi:hypothetical protein L083_2398 [Actinoplanes sp. N902-109]|nr:hypothetical protein L083_2398 [Actinoplanes sp. N902-109]
MGQGRCNVRLRECNVRRGRSAIPETVPADVGAGNTSSRGHCPGEHRRPAHAPPRTTVQGHRRGVSLAGHGAAPAAPLSQARATRASTAAAPPGLT